MKTVFACATMLCALGSTALHATDTSVVGQGQAFNIESPGLAVTEAVTLYGVFPTRQSLQVAADGTVAPESLGTGDDVLASVEMFAGNFAPQGTAMAQGQSLSIQQNTALFALLGNQYGGTQTSFNLPDLVGRAAVGAGASGNTSVYVGQQSGSRTATLTVANLPSHDHTATENGQTVTTSSVGGGQAYDSAKPTLGLTYLIQTEGVFPSQGASTGTDGLIGQIGLFAGNFAPTGFMQAAGQILNINANQALYAVIGNTYGGSAAQGTFALPNLVGRSAVGVGQLASGQPVTLGEAFGSNSTTLTEAQMPAHTHTLADGTVTSVEGSNAPIANYGASLGLNYIVYTGGGIYPTRDSALVQPELTQGGDTPTLGEISLFAGNYAPSGWSFANGQLLSIRSNPALFSLLGIMYGGDGLNTFALPDFRGRTALGSGSENGYGYTVGQNVGQASIVLGTANLPPHDHTYTPAAPPAPAVPEPATWATMILGFGLVGAAARRRAARPARA